MLNRMVICVLLLLACFVLVGAGWTRMRTDGQIRYARVNSDGSIAGFDIAWSGVTVQKLVPIAFQSNMQATEREEFGVYILSGQGVVQWDELSELIGRQRAPLRFTVVRIPIYLVVGVLLLYPAFVGGRRLFRGLYRRRRGLCRNCGYDVLRSGTDRCPECGKPVVQA